jgi:hypothetical protein
MNHHTLLVILAVAVGAGPAWAAAGQVAAGRGFKVSVPAGFVVATGDQVKSLIDMGGLALAATARFEGTGFLASIVVVPVAAPMEGDLGSPALCDQVAQGSAARAGATLTSQKIIAASWGPGCQYEHVATGNPGRGAIGTLVYRGKAGWGVTCNLDPKDQRARAACAEVLRSWKFDTASGGPPR